jgi:sugar transferase (PEP-CTERM/EpsH1 system associated)
VSHVGVSPDRVVQIYNGVDAERFAPGGAARGPISGCPFDHPDLWLVGTVGRMEAVKDQLNLARAMIRAVEIAPVARHHLRLIMIGAGNLRTKVLQTLQQANLDELAWLPGERSDVPEIMRGLDCFVLPSIAEGISNTILEAMASGVPVIATGVGGNAELIAPGTTGQLVPAADPDALARAILDYYFDRETARRHARAARRAVEANFALNVMVDRYAEVYEELAADHAKWNRGGQHNGAARRPATDV